MTQVKGPHNQRHVFHFRESRTKKHFQGLGFRRHGILLSQVRETRVQENRVRSALIRGPDPNFPGGLGLDLRGLDLRGLDLRGLDIGEMRGGLRGGLGGDEF